MKKTTSPLLSVPEACQYLNIGRDKLDEERRAGRLGYVQSKPNARIFFRQQDLDAWILRSVHPPRPPEAIRATYRKRRAPRVKRNPASTWTVETGKCSS